MSATYRTGSGAAAVRALLLALAVLLFLTAVLAILTDLDRWKDVDTGIKVSTIFSCISYFVLAGIALAALLARRFAADLLLLAATGWAVAWAFTTGPSSFPYLFEFAGEEYSTIRWTDWTSAIVGLLLAVVSAGFLVAIVGGASGVRTAASGGASTPGAGVAPPVSSVPPGWHTDPGGAPGKERWWDGSTWTDHLRDAR